MVGNMSDMQPLTATRQYMPRRFWKRMTPNVQSMPPMAKAAKRRAGLTYFIR